MNGMWRKKHDDSLNHEIAMLANSTAVLYNSAMYKQNDISTLSEKIYAFRFIDGLVRFIGCRTPHIWDYIIS